MIASKIVVAVAVLVAAVAAMDALRREEPVPGRAQAGHEIDRGPPPCRSLRPAACGEFAVMRGVVRRRGRPFLDRFDLARAFPGVPSGRVVAERLARADDGMLALGVRDWAGRSAIELWRGRRPAASFPVPPGSFAAGLAFDGAAVAAFGADGVPALYDRRGRRI